MFSLKEDGFMEKTKQKKPSQIHTLNRSLKFIYKNAWNYSKRYCLSLPIFILLSIILPMTLLAIPSLSVYFLTDQKDFGQFAMWVSIIFGVYILLQIYLELKRSALNWDQTFIRCIDVMRLSFMKCLSCDYDFYESKEGKEKRVKGLHATDSNWIGVEGMFKNAPTVLISLGGLIVLISTSSLISYQILLILLGMVIVNLALSAFASVKFEKYLDPISKSENKIQYVYNISKDELKGKDIRNYHLAYLFNSLLNKQVAAFGKYELIQHALFFLPNLSDSLFGYLRDFVAYSLLIKGFIVDKSISAAQFTLMISVINGISTYLTLLGSEIFDLLTSSKEVSALIDFLDSDSQFNTGKGIDLASLPQPMTIEFKDVSFTYKDANKPTISHLSFKVSPGEKIALVGENGAGKTTIIKLLSGFYKPTEGEILIDGHHLDEFNIDDYYSLLSVINQDVQVIGVSIKGNIACTLDDKKIDKIKLMKTIEEAGLKEKVDSLPKKEETVLTQNLDDNGIMLSGGEMQKLMLARALYKNGPLLMLDEPTSALDPIAEGELYQKYGELTKGKSSLFISHRLSSTRFCDRILYLKDGHIIEEGTHEELMKLNGEYKKVFEVQAHYYKEGGDENANAI